MNRKQWLLAAMVASPLSLALPPQAANAQASFDLRIGTPPPPPRVVALPPPRRGFVWVPGYWRWTGHRHVWVDGYWVHQRRGFRYAEPGWRQDGDRYVFRRGGWERY